MLIKRASTTYSCFSMLHGGGCTRTLVMRVCPILCTFTSPSSVIPYFKIKGEREGKIETGVMKCMS